MNKDERQFILASESMMLELWKVTTPKSERDYQLALQARLAQYGMNYGIPIYGSP